MEEMGEGRGAGSCLVGKTKRGPGADPGECPAGERGSHEATAHEGGKIESSGLTAKKQN